MPRYREWLGPCFPDYTLEFERDGSGHEAMLARGLETGTEVRGSTSLKGAVWRRFGFHGLCLVGPQTAAGAVKATPPPTRTAGTTSTALRPLAEGMAQGASSPGAPLASLLSFSVILLLCREIAATSQRHFVLYFKVSCLPGLMLLFSW